MKQRLSIIVTVLSVALVAPLFAQQPAPTTTVIQVDWEPLQGGCASFFQGQHDIPFTDTAGANWNQLTIRIPMMTSVRPPGTEPVPTVTIFINGVQIGQPVTVFNRSGGCWDNLQTYEFGTNSLPGYHPYGTNTFSVLATGWYVGGPPAELTFTTEPRKFQFDLVPAMSQKIILHQKPGDTDLSPWQVVSNEPTGKPRFRFRGTVTSNTASLDADVWLRVIDPPDTALYVPQADRVQNDNRDPLKVGVLMTRSCADPACRAQPGQPLQVRSSTGGVVEVDLETTDRYAGDNYYLEASFDPVFTCATAGANAANICPRSGQVTAWKRVYIEKRKMLRNGLFLATDAQAGDTFLITRGDHWGGNRGNHDALSKNEKIVVVHAPQLSRSDLNAGWYSETHTILSVQDLGTGEFRVNLGTKVGNTITPEPMQHDYTVDVRNVGDAVSKLDSLSITVADVFDAPMDLVTAEAFSQSFVENLILPDSTTPGATVPVPFFQTDFEPDLQDLVEKWSSVVNGTLEPGHQLLIIASKNQASGAGTAAGVTISQAGARTSSWVFWDSIDGQINGNNVNNVYTWAKKTAAHEIAHQWRTNGIFGRFDHCPPTTKVWNDQAVYCLLADFTSTGSGAISERMNGIARFHYMTLPSGDTHSEYLEIRRRTDPFMPFIP